MFKRDQPMDYGLATFIILVLVGAAMLASCETVQRSSSRGGGRSSSAVSASVSDNPTIIRNRTKNGSIIYHADNGVFRRGGRRGEILYHWDGQFLRKGGRNGEKLLHVSGNVVRIGGARGKILLVIEGPRIRRGGRRGEVLFYKDEDGRTLLKGGRNGDRHYFYQSGLMKDWMIIASIYSEI